MIDWLFSSRRVFDGLFKAPGNGGLHDQDLLIVRRGLSPAFYFFCQTFAREHGLIVVPDRRAKDRRRRQKACASIERRSDDRRRPNSNELEKNEFLVVRGKRSLPRLEPS